MTVSTVSSAEPDTTEYPYAGWVPTANGRLSFRHIGESRYPRDTTYANIGTNARRLILAYQHRNLSDALFRAITHYLCDIDDNFYFVLAAVSDGTPSAAEEIYGAIYIFKSKEDWKSKAQIAIRGYIETLNDVRLSLSSMRDEIAERALADGTSLLQNTADISVKFIVHRTGEIFVAKPLFSDSELEYASTDYAVQWGHDMPKWIADQSYFFFRDVSHQHQHHAPSSDTILLLQQRDKAGVAWRRNCCCRGRSRRHGVRPRPGGCEMEFRCWK